MTLEQPRYPVYVISKGRADRCLTARFLEKDGVDFSVVVEPQERAAYAEHVDPKRLIVAPFSNLGQGSIPARNFVWDHSTKRGAERHWIFDDNIVAMCRRWKARKIVCEAGAALRAMEAFVDRYENVAIAGPNYYMFVPNKKNFPPFFLNVHVYSCLLIDNAIPHRWRGRYNEDTDLCLQVLSAGLCTVQFQAFMCWKMATMTMKGGNTAELYKGDGRLKMARSLERAWPGVVETKRKFRRPQHSIKYVWRRFDAPLKLKPGVDLSKLPAVDDMGMTLDRVKETKSEELRRLVEE